MRRRTFLAASAATLALPSVARAQKQQVLKFIAQSDLAILDPIWTTAYVTRNHGFMVFDTLYGQTGQKDGFTATPQMIAGHVIDDGGKTWKLTLRDGLMFHDGERVLARDCVASIKRWGARDAFGQALMARTDELSAPDDKTILFRLKQPFALLPNALCHGASNMCAMMPQRIAETDPFKAFTEVVGSGPFKFNTNERVQGSLFVYDKFDKYKPREDGEVSFTAGPKIVHFDRVEWHVQPDQATKAAAMQAGEMDWWENPSADLLPVLRKANIQTPITDHTGAPYLLRPNHLYPPFDKPAVRRALMGAIDQKEYMTAMMGEETSLWSAPCGFFPPVSPLASDAGLSAVTGKRDYAAVKIALEKAGYQGDKIVLVSGFLQRDLHRGVVALAGAAEQAGVAGQRETGGRSRHGADQSEVSSPIIGVMYSFWSIAPISARRTAGLSNGDTDGSGHSNYGRHVVVGQWRLRCWPCAAPAAGRRAAFSHQSISPACMAAGHGGRRSGLTCHSTRSKWAMLRPAVQLASPSSRGL